jgi:MtN3 and saliva related transmembrane protein
LFLMPNWIDIIGVLAGLCGIAGFAPQIAKILREREAHAISIRMYMLATTGFTLWVIYGLAQKSWPLIAANGVMLAMAATILALKLKFK